MRTSQLLMITEPKSTVTKSVIKPMRCAEMGMGLLAGEITRQMKVRVGKYFPVSFAEALFFATNG